MKNRAKYPILICILGIFFGFLLVGYIIGFQSEKPSLNMKNIYNYNMLNTFIIIIIKNTFAYFLLLSTIIFGKKIAYFFFGVNGYIIGLTIAKFNSLKLALTTILPHGIFEMGFFIFTGYFLINYINRNSANLKKYIVLSYFGILASAIIESTITPKLIILILQ